MQGGHEITLEPAETERRGLPHPLRIGILVYDGVQLLNVAGPTEVFGAANRQTLTTLPAALRRTANYEVVLMSPHGGLVRTSSGVELNTVALDALSPDEFDTVAVAGGLNIESVTRHYELVDWLRQWSSRIRRIASFGGGSFVLARAGLLDDRKCVTHWHHGAAMQKSFPNIKVDGGSLFVRDGKCFTAAGSAASLDVAMQMVEEDFGKPLALKVARVLVVPFKRPGTHPQLSAELQAQSAAIPKIAAAADWIMRHIDQKPTISALAARFAMSERNFSRVFKRHMGLSPQNFLERVRVETARRWLVESGLPIEKVARRSGFSGADHMGAIFRKHLKMTPADYRVAHGAPGTATARRASAY